MTSYLTPKKNAAYKIYICLYDSSGDIVNNPTIAAGDFKVSTDGGTVGNLATLPSVAPASSDQVMIDLSADEMNGDNVHIIYKDQTSPKAWQDGDITIHTTARQIDDLAFPTTSGRGIDVETGGTVGLDFANINAASAPTTLTNITVPTVTTLTGHTAQTGDAFARLGAPVGASISADIAAITAPTVAQILAGVVEGTVTVKQALQVLLAVLAGKASGGGTTTITFRDTTDAVNRVAMAVDADGNRTNVTRTYS